MTTLYNITGEYKELLALSSDPDSELSQDALRDTLESLAGEFQNKAISIVEVVNSIGHDLAAIESEIDRLKERKRIIENRDKSIRDYLKTNMEAAGINKIQCPLFTITLAQGRDVVVIDSEDELPNEYITVKTSTQPNKPALLKALKEGSVSGAHLEKSAPSLRIK